MTVVAAIDRSQRAPDVVGEARAIADAFGDDLHVVHVLGQQEFMDLEYTSMDDTGQPVPMDEVRRVATEIAEETLEAADCEGTGVGLVGAAAKEVIRYAEEQDARYVVIGGRHRTPVGKAVFGSVTQDVLLGADRPVVTVIRPEDE